MSSRLPHCRRALREEVRISAIALCLALSGCWSDEPTAVPAGPPPASDAGADDVTTSESEAAANDDGGTDADTSTVGATETEQPTESPEMQRTRELFATMLHPASAEEWDAAHLELEGLGQAVTPVLIELLQSDDQIEREMAAQELVLLVVDVSQHQAELLAALDDPSEQVRSNCAVALLTQSPESAERAIAVLIDALDTPDPSLREMAAINIKTFPEVVVSQLPQVLATIETASAEVAVPLIEALAVAGPSAVGATDVLNELAAGDDAEIAAAARAALDAINPLAE